MARARTAQASVMAAATVRSARATTSRALAYLPPWLMWLSLPVLALVFWLVALQGRAASMLVAVVLTASTGGLARFTWHVYGRREPSVQIHATCFVVGCGVWVLLAATFDLFVRPDVDVWPQVWRAAEWLVKAFNWPWAVWLVAGIPGCLTWSIRRVAVPPDGKGDDGAGSKLAKVLDGAKLHVKQIEGRVVGQIEADRGAQTIRDLQAKAEGLESLHGLRRGAVRITPTDDHGLGNITITPVDPLAGEVRWAGPSLPGGHIADAPIPFGIAEDGEPGLMWLPGDEAAGRNLVHYLVEGANGSGKSMAWRAAIADALTRTAGAGVRVYGIDVSGKHLQTFGPLIPYLTRLATTPKDAKALIRDLSAHVAEKQQRMGAAGHTQWSRDCGEPFEILWLEEGAEIAADSAALTRAAERWRSAGVMLVIVIQRASHENVDTTTRSQLGGVTCFGVNAAGQGSNCFSLPDTALDQGADPESWGSRYPGKVYLITSTTPQDRLAVPHRAPKTTNDELAAALAQHCTPTGRQPDAAPAAAAQRDDEEEDVEPIPRDLDPNIDTDPEQQIRPPTAEQDIAFAPPAQGRKLPTAEARAVVQRHLRTLLEQGKTHTQPADVCAMKPETTRTREWVRQEMIRLCSEPEPGELRLERDDADVPGVYRIVAPVAAGV